MQLLSCSLSLSVHAHQTLPPLKHQPNSFLSTNIFSVSSSSPPSFPTSTPMAEPKPTPMPSLSPRHPISLIPSHKKTPSKPAKFLRGVRTVFRTLPIISPACRLPVSLTGNRLHDIHVSGGTRMTGTLFGFKKQRVNLAIQETPRSLPLLLLELAIPTGKLLQDMGKGLFRIAMECEKHPSEKTKILDEPLWSLYCNGRKSGYGVKREATEDDLRVMQMLHAVSMGAGVLPLETSSSSSPPEKEQQVDGEIMYMRAYFERISGSRDSETFYMMNPDGNNAPELSIFFVRI